MLNFDEEKLASLSEEYGVSPELITEVVDAANSFEFIRDDEERKDFVGTVLLTYIVGNPYRTSYPTSDNLQTLGDTISNAAYDGYDYYMTTSDRAAVARVRARLTNEK